jgi:hypothetical protein
MCRHQLPVWQEFYAAHRAEDFEILSVSVDALGPSVVRPWTERAHAGFTTVVDQENLLAGAFGFKAVPNGLLVDANGILRFKQFGGFDIRNAVNRTQVESFIGQSFAAVDAAPLQSIHAATASADESWETHFQTGVRWLESGHPREAAVELRQALLLDPANYLVRKQLWRTLHPDKFGEQIDLQWQKDQIERESQMGYERANPVG